MRVVEFDRRPEVLRVIHMHGVCQLVDNHVVNEFVRQPHEGDIEANRAGRATTSPPAASVRKAHSAIVIACLVSHKGESSWEIAFRLDAQCLDDNISNIALYRRLGNIRRGWQRDNNLLAVHGDMGIPGSNGSYDDRVTFAHTHAVAVDCWLDSIAKQTTELISRGMNKTRQGCPRYKWRMRDCQVATWRDTSSNMSSRGKSPQDDAAKFIVNYLCHQYTSL